MNTSPRLQDRVAVVTGSTQGIGLIIAQALAAAGAKIVICSRSESAVEAACSQLEAAKHQVFGLPCDVADPEQVENLAQQTLERFGQIDVWFNNASVNRYFGPALDLPIDHWHEVINTNLNGAYYGTMTALRHMLPRDQGKIINMLGAGAQDSPGDSYLSAYATSKAAARRLTLVVAEDYKQTGISVLGMNPGLFSTQLTTKIQPLNDEAHRRMKFLDFGLRWLATSPETIAQTAVRVASDATNGQTGKIYRCWPGFSKTLQREYRRMRKVQPS
ncbi:2-dehydro-3-deoxy-D-gluconate 5-dehydrogenase [Acaryochloris thomasi RCC1774]|uniref:2-dehydro-3-deoxy-D-gluconate 5-dehydrogenase n=1 Tax=Acaryochloris thomasi RCC1774 TaxID=1764569 RepID=A0A2W1JGW1_9CYAN|nr:SDR family oxidoreductase [Acaryochloris thomasi]PZD72799.1 2-dehydro-3-deoxy-D-gluconate 5-dehydrogenase [Acaryochloris thomasi RCC1774]